MERQEIARRLVQVAAYRASGQKAKAWAQANGVPLRDLAIWCAHARRWQARLDGVSLESGRTPRSNGFVAARAATSSASTASVRVEVNAATARLELHWPLTHARELAALLRELSR